MPLDLWMGVLIAVAGFGPIIVTALMRHRRGMERVALWSEAARRTGLAAIRVAPVAVTAEAEGLRVRMSLLYKGGEIAGTQLEVTGARLAPGLRLHIEGADSLLGLRARKEIEIGDEEFDREVSVQGPPALALAVLDAETRHAVESLLRGRLGLVGHRPLWVSGRLDDGTLRLEVPERAPHLRRTQGDKEPPPAGTVYLDGEHRLPEVLSAALDLATRLSQPEDLAQRLAARLADEPEAGVRLSVLRTLLREFPEHPATPEALVAARGDPDAEVRVRAAILLGADGRDTLLGVAAGEGAEDATSARAVAALAASLTVEQASELLRSALRTRRMLTAKECLAILGRHGDAAVPILAKVLLVEQGELCEAAARGLAATADPAAEDALLRALAEGPPELRRAAASALGRVGTRAAVLPLREAEQGDGALRGVARQAIAEIHARLAGAAQGQLSLADGESGRLSIAEDETGHLSLSEGSEQAPT